MSGFSSWAHALTVVFTEFCVLCFLQVEINEQFTWHKTFNRMFRPRRPSSAVRLYNRASAISCCTLLVTCAAWSSFRSRMNVAWCLIWEAVAWMKFCFQCYWAVVFGDCISACGHKCVCNWCLALRWVHTLFGVFVFPQVDLLGGGAC